MKTSRVSHYTMSKLLTFSNMANGIWPLPVNVEPLWRRFVIAACHTDTAFDVSELTDWFTTNGWSLEAAHAIVERFLNEADFLSEYDDARPDYENT